MSPKDHILKARFEMYAKHQRQIGHDFTHLESRSIWAVCMVETGVEHLILKAFVQESRQGGEPIFCLRRCGLIELLGYY